LISEQKVLKRSKNHYFYCFSTLRNQQVAGSSLATSSRNLRKSKDSRRFSLLFLHHLRHEIRHLFRRAFLHLPCDVSADAGKRSFF